MCQCQSATKKDLFENGWRHKTFRINRYSAVRYAYIHVLSWGLVGKLDGSGLTAFDSSGEYELPTLILAQKAKAGITMR